MKAPTDKPAWEVTRRDILKLCTLTAEQKTACDDLFAAVENLPQGFFLRLDGAGLSVVRKAASSVFITVARHECPYVEAQE